MRLQHTKLVAANLSTDQPDRVAAKAVIVAEVERLHWRIWNGKAKNAQRSLDRIRKVMHVFKAESSQGAKGVASRKLWYALHEVDKYLRGQAGCLVNYARRFRAGQGSVATFGGGRQSPVRGGSAHLSRGNFEQCGDELCLGLDVVATEGVSEFLCVRRVQSHPPLGKKLYLTNDRPGKAMMLADPCSLVRSKRRFFRPDLPFHRQACVSPVKFAARGGTGATRSPPLGGEHGEDPQFDRAEHDVTLAASQGLTLGAVSNGIRPRG
jgi:hypothetical protein